MLLSAFHALNQSRGSTRRAQRVAWRAREPLTTPEASFVGWRGGGKESPGTRTSSGNIWVVRWVSRVVAVPLFTGI